MGVPLQYIYFIGTLISFIPWLVIFILRKDLRKEMVTMGFSFMIFAVIAEYVFWTIDYWQPVTITGTRIGIEDFMLGFSNGGFIPVLYEFVFKKHHVQKKQKNNVIAAFLAIVVVTVLSVLFFVFHLTSALATVTTFTLGALFIVWRRKDLVWYALASGLLVGIAVIPIYLILEYLSPVFIQKTWLFAYLSNIRILDIPIEDLLYYFGLGVFLGPFYVFWKNERLKN